MLFRIDGKTRAFPLPACMYVCVRERERKREREREGEREMIHLDTV